MLNGCLVTKITGMIRILIIIFIFLLLFTDDCDRDRCDGGFGGIFGDGGIIWILILLFFLGDFFFKKGRISNVFHDI